MNRWDVINHLVNKYNYKTYLEIGIGLGNFEQVICDLKIGVDPLGNVNPTHIMTSDQFFEDNRFKFDIIFVDGWHTEYQAMKDILNSFNCLNVNGSIVVHDCIPQSEITQRNYNIMGAWNGEVWKAWVKLRTYPYKMFVVEVDEGCGVIRNNGSFQGTFKPEIPLTYENLAVHLREWLNIVTWEEFEAMP